MQTKVCICHAIPTLNPAIELVVLRHWKERLKPSNTARLASHAIPNLKLIDYGAPGQPWDPNSLNLDGAALLFPDPDAPTLASPERIIIVDGSWPQARKLVNKIDGLSTLPRFRITPPTEHRIRLRTPPDPGCVSTLEAIAAVLDATEGPQAGDSLRTLFDAAVLSATITRGRPLHA